MLTDAAWSALATISHSCCCFHSAPQDAEIPSSRFSNWRSKSLHLIPQCWERECYASSWVPYELLEKKQIFSILSPPLEWVERLRSFSSCQSQWSFCNCVFFSARMCPTYVWKWRRVCECYSLSRIPSYSPHWNSELMLGHVEGSGPLIGGAATIRRIETSASAAAVFFSPPVQKDCRFHFGFWKKSGHQKTSSFHQTAENRPIFLSQPPPIVKGAKFITTGGKLIT